MFDRSSHGIERYLVEDGLSVRPGSRAVQPAALESRESQASTLVSAWAHLGHWLLRYAKPSDTGVTAAVIIRVWQFGQRGRWIGNSSGSGFVVPSMTKKVIPPRNPCLSGARPKIEITFGGSAGLPGWALRAIGRVRGGSTDNRVPKGHSGPNRLP